MIILISGKAGSGKDYVGEVLRKYIEKLGMSVIQTSFARCLKEDALFMGWDNKKDERGRKLLQDLGKAYRNYNKDIFVNKLTDMITGYYLYTFDVIIVTDCRYLNEIVGIEKTFNGAIKIRVESSKTQEHNWQKDESECELDNYKNWNYILENDFKEDFKEKIKDMAKEIMKNTFGFEKYLVSCDKCSAVPKKTELIFEFPNGFNVSLLHENQTKIDIDITNPEIDEHKVMMFRDFAGDDFLSVDEAKQVLKFIQEL